MCTVGPCEVPNVVSKYNELCSLPWPSGTLNLLNYATVNAFIFVMLQHTDSEPKKLHDGKHPQPREDLHSGAAAAQV